MGRVKPGDGRALQRFRWWQLFSRSLFHLYLPGGEGTMPEVWSVDVRHGGDPKDGVVYGLLYRDGVNQARAKLPASFPVPGGTIRVAVSTFGLKRCDYVTPDGSRRQLTPDPASAEGRRARLDRTRPALSRSIGIASVVVLLVGLALGVPQIIEQVTHIPFVQERVGAFTSPVSLPAWANIVLVLTGGMASTERALRLRYNGLLDGGLLDGEG